MNRINEMDEIGHFESARDIHKMLKFCLFACVGNQQEHP
jgi:hypothetical protein